MIVYKLTDENGMTRNNTKWIPGEWLETSGKGDLCGPGWLHCYSDPVLGAFMNPSHANFSNPTYWKAEGDGEQKNDQGLKMGFSKLRILEKIESPKVTLINKAAFGILCAKEINKDPGFQKWADNWLNGADRSEAASEAASWAASWAASRAASEAASEAASWASRAASRAASEAASWASRAASWPNTLIILAHKALEIK